MATDRRPLRHYLGRTSTTLLSLGLAAAVAGCAGTASADAKPAATSASTQKSAPALPTPTAKAYGDVVGTGKMVKTADGGSYETIALPADSPIYTYQPSQALLAAGYSAADGVAGKKLVADYMTTQFMDSTALETRDAGFADWARGTSGNWFAPDLHNDVVKNPQGGQVVLGDLGTMKSMPALVHDGKPRTSQVSLQFTQVAPFDQSGHKGIAYDVTYLVSYRVPTSSAAAYAASLGNETVAQFLASGRAKPKVKGSGEVYYVATGSGQIIAEKQASGGWLISGLNTHTDYNLSDFVDNG